MGTTTKVVKQSFWWLALTLAFRFAVGLPMDGNLHTNATFWSAGTEDIRERKWFALRNPSRWAYLPGVIRIVSRSRFTLNRPAGVSSNSSGWCCCGCTAATWT